MNEYVVFWMHRSSISPAGNKSKGKLFDSELKALILYDELVRRQKANVTYQSGYVSHVVFSKVLDSSIA